MLKSSTSWCGTLTLTASLLLQRIIIIIITPIIIGSWLPFNRTLMVVIVVPQGSPLQLLYSLPTITPLTLSLFVSYELFKWANVATLRNVRCTIANKSWQNSRRKKKGINETNDERERCRCGESATDCRRSTSSNLIFHLYTLSLSPYWHLVNVLPTNQPTNQRYTLEQSIDFLSLSFTLLNQINYLPLVSF